MLTDAVIAGLKDPSLVETRCYVDGHFVGERMDKVVNPATGEALGGADGLVGFLKAHAVAYPVAFLSLVAKTLPYQISGVDGGAIKTEHHATIDASLLDQDQRDELRRLLLAATPAIR